MSQFQSWPLSQDANKSSGTCSVCLAVRQLHLKDGTVHKHGPRSNPCPGSHKPPLGSSQPCVSVVKPTTSHTSDRPSDSDSSNALPDSPNNGDFLSLPDWAVAKRPLIKHIPKSARAACASHLAGLLRAVVSSSHDTNNWTATLS